MSKLIVIEGTDCSGKETQSKLLVEKLNEMGYKAVRINFPNYDSPTGKIVGGPYLGKDYICDGFFPEGAANVDPKVASLYYTADRIYNIDKILKPLSKGINVILDRYVESNMAHQAGKLTDEVAQNDMIDWLEHLEYQFLELPRPDMTILLFMPYEYACELKKNREEKADQHEANPEHLLNAQKTYLKLAKRYGYDVIKCVDDNSKRIKTIDEISEEIQKLVLETYCLTCQIDRED